MRIWTFTLRHIAFIPGHMDPVLCSSEPFFQSLKTNMNHPRVTSLITSFGGEDDREFSFFLEPSVRLLHHLHPFLNWLKSGVKIVLIDSSFRWTVVLLIETCRWIENPGRDTDSKMVTNNLYLDFFSPWRIVDDCGGAFALGTIGGTLFHSIKGFRHAPSVS